MNKKIAVLILMLAGALFFSIAMVSVNKSAKLRKFGSTAEATVTGRTGNKGLSTVTVLFNTSDGKSVTAKASKRGYVSSGEKVMIYYDQASPQTIDFGDTTGYNMRGVIAGGLLFLVGLYYFIRFSYMDNLKKNLLKSGKKIDAEFISVDRNEKYNMGENNPWVLKCKWTDITTGIEYTFLSKDYIIDPLPYLKGRSHIDVFIDPADPGRYYMDTSFMPRGNNTIG
jgi:hypothetical protein